MTNDTRLLFAPFKGLTTKVYRNAFARHFGGFDEMVAPFISGTGTIRVNPAKLDDIIPPKENFAPVIPQFISTDAREIILLGEALQTYGYSHMNWNLGCPFSRIAGKYRGCGILPHPDMLESLLDKVFASVKIQLSVKTRLGYKDPDEIIDVINVLNKYPLKEITIHARTGLQVYRGEVNPDYFRKCIQLSDHSLIFNGDLYNLPRFRQYQSIFPELNTWMIGRGALMNPFLALEIKGINLGETGKRERLEAFLAELLEKARQKISNKRKCLGWMKAIWYYLAGSFSGGEQAFAALKRIEEFSDYEKLTDTFLSLPFANATEQENYFRHHIKHV